MASSMIEDGAFFTDGLNTGFAEELQDIGLVPGTVNWLL
jgi:hypothetical protein